MAFIETPERNSVIVKPRTTISRDGEVVSVHYNPGLMTPERAIDLFVGGMGFYAASIGWIIGYHSLAIATLLISLVCVYEGIKRPKEKARRLTAEERQSISS